jgi:elongation factor Ts
MSNFTAADVKELREITGIGMMDCKKALSDSNGDKDEALKLLKEKGLAVAAKRAGRETKEGVILIENKGDAAYIIKVGSETDFVAKADDFQNLTKTIMQKFIENGESYIGSEEQQNLITEVSGKTGEKVQLSDAIMYKTDKGYIESYIHSNNKVGVLVEITCPLEVKDNEELRTFSKDVSMQIAAMNPFAITQDEISDEIKAEQKEIIMNQMEDSGKPKDILEKIVQGKLDKHFKDLCLLDMAFVKDSKMTIKELLKKTSDSVKAEISITKFVRLQIGS